ncbi:MAG TPA: DUF302 domain-containing protein [Candidatus Angelobacter sp.]|nr:DUF302 domain-containing protein [Candidatus Angelobacter sp.]
MTAQKYGYAKTVNCSFADAVGRVKNALQEQGFGVQAEIDISGALREKLGVEIPPQIILGACNPQLAYQALQAEPEISLLLPCNVTVRQAGQTVEVAVIDAEKLMEFVGNPELKPLASEAKRKLQAVLEKV